MSHGMLRGGNVLAVGTAAERCMIRGTKAVLSHMGQSWAACMVSSVPLQCAQMASACMQAKLAAGQRADKGKAAARGEKRVQVTAPGDDFDPKHTVSRLASSHVEA